MIDLSDIESVGVPGSNLSADPQETADERGQVVVSPKDSDLLIDIDTDADRRHCYHMLAIMKKIGYPTVVLRDEPSKTGAGHRHMYVRVVGRTLTAHERIALQAACGSDRKRELLSVLRTWCSERAPTLLFESPGFEYPEEPVSDKAPF